jgi:2-keto-3-deoxy-L-rhamnonate aldolase RhmA
MAMSGATVGEPDGTASGANLEFKARLARNEMVLGLNTPLSRTPEIGPIARAGGYHWMLIDDEHHPMPSDLAYNIALSAIRAGIMPIARPRSNSPHDIGACLTNAALGVAVPHVNTEAQAIAAARACYYPPLGDLSVPGVIVQLGYDRYSLDEAAAAFNREVVCIVMIESREAVANVEAIAAVPGVHGLLIGASDLCFEMGLPGAYGDPRMVDAVRSVCNAARANSKFVGMGGPKNPADWKRYIDCGVRMVMTENDLAMLIARMKERTRYFLDLGQS